MPSQPTLRPFDVAVALRLLLEPESRYEPLAEALVTSTSAVHRSVARLQLAGLCGSGTRTVVRSALQEFLLHGVRYAFPAVVGAERAGVPTAVAHPAVAALLGDAASVRPMVWASESGSSRGASVAPLFAGVPSVAARDARMYELLALVDALRTAHGADQKVLGAALTQRLQTQ